MRRWWGTEICRKKIKKKKIHPEILRRGKWMINIHETHKKEAKKSLLQSPAGGIKQQWKTVPCAALMPCWGWEAPALAGPARLLPLQQAPLLGNLSWDIWLAPSLAANLGCKVNALGTKVLFQSCFLQVQWGFCCWLRATVNLNSKPKGNSSPCPPAVR